MTWRDKARPIIAAVIEQYGTADEAALRAALREAYPWGPRQYHPYKIWCDEIREQLGTKPPKPPRARKAVVEAKKTMEGQKELFQ